MTPTLQITQYGTFIRYGNRCIPTATEKEGEEIIEDPDFEKIFNKECEKYEC